MFLVGLMLVRNEEWVLRFSLPAALMWIDHVVVINHASEDSSGEIIADLCQQYPGRITILEEPDPIWYEMRYRQRMLDTARGLKASHIVTIDADEALSSNLIPIIRRSISRLQSSQILQLFWSHTWKSLTKQRVDGGWYDKWVTSVFCDHREFYWKARDGYDFHHRHPFGRCEFVRTFSKTQGAMVHLQHLVWRRLLAKQALYKITETVRWPGRSAPEEINQKYDATVNDEGIELAPIPNKWWEHYAALLPEIDLTEDQAPWQEVECLRHVEKYGRDLFRGLNLYGVV